MSGLHQKLDLIHQGLVSIFTCSMFFSCHGYLFSIINPKLLLKLSFTWLQENLQQWLTDEKARDQFVIRAGSDTEVLWNDARQLKPDPVYKRSVS